VRERDTQVPGRFLRPGSAGAAGGDPRQRGPGGVHCLNGDRSAAE